MTFQTIKIPGRDGFLLDAALHLPKQTSKGVVIINAGTVIPKPFYEPFAEYLSKKGFTTIRYDYRGVGQSRPVSLKGFQASIRDWARLDIAGVLDWVKKNYPAEKCQIIAHSMGGQIMGLVDNWNYANSLLTVASSTGNWQNYTGPFKWQTMVYWATLFPLATKLLGYLPASAFGMGDDWPKGISEDWWKWSVKRSPLFEILNKGQEIHFFEDFNLRMKAIYVADDFMATPKVIPFFERDYANTNLQIEMIHPADYGKTKIGHFGFFLERHRALWSLAVDWLEVGLVD